MSLKKGDVVECGRLYERVEVGVLMNDVSEVDKKEDDTYYRLHGSYGFPVEVDGVILSFHWIRKKNEISK